MGDVPYTGGEKESLWASLDRHRDAVLWKLTGLSDEQLRRRVTPSGTSLLGLVRHLAVVEYGWFSDTFGGATEPFPFDPAVEDADFRIEPHTTMADVLAYYDRARASADAVIGTHPIDAVAESSIGIRVSLRWVLIHLIEETARHAGHADIVRELLDGTTGAYPG